MRILFLLLLLISGSCKKASKEEERHAVTAPVAPLTGNAICGAPLDLFSAVAPPVYAPLLQTSKPQLEELLYGDKYRTLLISFQNTPVPGREEETTADYGKYKVCASNGTCLKSCVNGTCTEEVVTGSWVEEFPIPDASMTNTREVFSVYTTSCVNASRRKDSDSPSASVAASNPECGPWNQNIVQHVQNADPDLEKLLLQSHQSDLNRQALSENIAKAAQVYLQSVSPADTGAGLSLAGAASDTSGNANLQLLANNAVVAKEKMGAFLQEGMLESLQTVVQNAQQQAKQTTGLALSSGTSNPCAGGGASSIEGNTPPPDSTVTDSTVTDPATAPPPLNNGGTDNSESNTNPVTDTTSESSSKSLSPGVYLMFTGLGVLVVAGVVKLIRNNIQNKPEINTQAVSTEGKLIAEVTTEIKVAEANVAKLKTELAEIKITPGERITGDGGTQAKHTEKNGQLEKAKAELAEVKAKVAEVKPSSEIEVTAKAGKTKLGKLGKFIGGWGGVLVALALIIVGALFASDTFLAETPETAFQGAISAVGDAYKQSKLEWANTQTALDALLTARSAATKK